MITMRMMGMMRMDLTDCLGFETGRTRRGRGRMTRSARRERSPAGGTPGAVRRSRSDLFR